MASTTPCGSNAGALAGFAAGTDPSPRSAKPPAFHGPAAGSASPRAASAINVARLVHFGLTPEEPRPPSMPTDGELSRWRRTLQGQARLHQDLMARTAPADKEDLAAHRIPGCLPAGSPSRGSPPSHRELAKELRYLQAILQGKDLASPTSRRKAFCRITPQMQAAASKVVETLDDEDKRQNIFVQAAKRASKEKEVTEMVAKDVVISGEPEMVCKLRPLSLQLQMPMEDLLLGRVVFNQFHQDSDGCLDVKDFEAAALELLRAQDKFQDAVAECLAEISEQLSSQGPSNGLSLEEFLTWYARGLQEGLLATDSHQVTELAALHGTSVEYVFRLKRSFDACSAEHPGLITVDEFARLLQKVLRVPPQLEFPPSRARFLWTEIRGNCARAISFEDFLQWWVRYFAEDAPGSQAPFEVFYGSVRRMGEQHLDPLVPLTTVEVEGHKREAAAEEEMEVAKASTDGASPKTSHRTVRRPTA